jgi:hypothetical protein
VKLRERNLALEPAKVQAEHLSRVVYAGKVLQLTAQNLYGTPQLLNRSSCVVLSVNYVASVAFKTKIVLRDRLANINLSEFQNCEIIHELGDNSLMITSVLIIHLW